MSPERTAGRFGGDPGAMRRAAHELDSQAERIGSFGESMSAEVHRVWWKGPDADRFRADWEQIHRRSSRRIAGDLRRLAGRLRQEAERQEGASRA